MGHPMNSEQAKSQLRQLRPQRLIGRLRPLLPTIDEQIRVGVRREDIVKALNQQGLAVSLKYLDVALYRWRRKHHQQQTETAPRASAPIPLARPDPASPAAPASTPDPNHVRNKGDLARLRRGNQPDLQALEQLGKSSTRSKRK